MQYCELISRPLGRSFEIKKNLCMEFSLLRVVLFVRVLLEMSFFVPHFWSWDDLSFCGSIPSYILHYASYLVTGSFQVLFFSRIMSMHLFYCNLLPLWLRYFLTNSWWFTNIWQVWQENLIWRWERPVRNTIIQRMICVWTTNASLFLFWLVNTSLS